MEKQKENENNIKDTLVGSGWLEVSMVATWSCM